MSTDRHDPPATLADAMMDLAVQVEPFHEFLTGQVAYFAGQGFTAPESLAMAACEFVTVFGANIVRQLPEGWGNG